MWIFNRAGFFSVTLVEEGEKSGQLQVRARVEEDLDRLRKMYAPELGPTIMLPNRDYPYRAYITHEKFSEAMVRATLDIDYTNFKAMVAKEQGYDRAHLYGGVWGVMNDAERKLGERVKKAGRRATQKELL